jgi:polysaccharide pyruvyl transferase WcaK-like protein
MTKLRVLSDVLGYFGQGRHTIHYTGWVGYRNLGDEILLEAARESLVPAKVVWVRDFGNPLARGLINRHAHELAMLGGGTQIGEQSPIDRFKAALARSSAGFVFGAGVTPALDGPVPAWLASWGEVLRPLEYVGTRGPESAETLRRVGVNAQVLGDPVCWFSKSPDFWQPEPQLIGMNIGTSHGHMYGDESAVQRTFVEVAKQLLLSGHRIEFFCVWPEDLETTRRVAAEAGLTNPVIHEIYEGAATFQESVRRMQVFVGIKLHACALAMCAGVPTLMVEYRAKCREFAGTIGVEEFCIRSDSLDARRMLELVEQLKARGPAIAAGMHQRAQVIKQRIVALSKDLLTRHGWGPAA